MCVEMARHAGHADIIRELIDGAAGNNDGSLPDQTAEEWATYRLRLEKAALEAVRRKEGIEAGASSDPTTAVTGER
jgi:hypothetical protein